MSHLYRVRRARRRAADEKAHAQRSVVTESAWRAGQRRGQESRRHRLKVLHLAGGA